MTLDSFLEQRGLTEAEFGRLIGLTQPAVNRLRKGRVPNPTTMRAIVKATSGAVTPNDFYGLTAAVAA